MRHYPFRNYNHLLKRIYKDRANLEREGANYHYDNMKYKLEEIANIKGDMFHVDNGIDDLTPKEKFDWDIVYGKVDKEQTDEDKNLKLEIYNETDIDSDDSIKYIYGKDDVKKD